MEILRGSGLALQGERKSEAGGLQCNSFEMSFSSLSIFSLGAYKSADGKKIDGRRVVVDVERGRTVKSWRPRRLGEWVWLCVCVCESIEH